MSWSPLLVRSTTSDDRVLVRLGHAYYTTDPTFEPTLTAQRDHANQQDQHHRADLFQMLIDTNHKANP